MKYHSSQIYVFIRLFLTNSEVQLSVATGVHFRWAWRRSGTPPPFDCRDALGDQLFGYGWDKQENNMVRAEVKFRSSFKFQTVNSGGRSIQTADPKCYQRGESLEVIATPCSRRTGPDCPTIQGVFSCRTYIIQFLPQLGTPRQHHCARVG